MGASGFLDEKNNLGAFEFMGDVEGQALLAEQVRGALFSGGRRFELALAANAISAVGGSPSLGVTSLSSSPAACRAQVEMTLAVNVADADSAGGGTFGTGDAGAAYRGLSGAAAPMNAAVAALSPAQLTASLAAERCCRRGRRRALRHTRLLAVSHSSPRLAGLCRLGSARR